MLNIDNVNKDVAKELITILSYCDELFIRNIPQYILIKINNLAADSKKEFYIDKNKTLMEQNISNECKDLITTLYFMYMTDSNTKKDILKMLLQNTNLN